MMSAGVPLMRLAFAFCLVLVSAAPLGAQSVVLSARQRLATYDLRGSGTTDVLRELGTFLTGPGNEAEKREGRFLRALAASDLLILARVQNDSELEQRVAQALGVAPAEVRAHLDGELRQLEVGYYAEAATEARALLRDLGAWTREGLTPITGIRRDYLYLRSVLAELERAQDATTVLETIGTDPCGTRCDGVLAALVPASRKVFASVHELRRIVRDLVRARRQNDPFISALEPPDQFTARITAIPLHLHYVVPESTVLPQTNNALAAASATPNAIAFISATEIRIANLPTVQLTPDGSAALDSRDPTYPGGSTVRLPPSFGSRPQLTPIDSLVPALRERFSGARVALAPVPNVEAHIVVRVALTLRAAGAQIVAVTGRTETGTTVFYPVTLTETPENAGTIVHVTPSGYSVEVGRRRVEIPRIREGSGARYDAQGLGRQLGTETASRTELRFARTTAAGAIVSAVSQMRTNRPTALVIAP